jgi:sec-independent protein translocase protein TatA
MGSFGSGELIIVLVIVLLVFGGSQLPKLAKNLGKAQKEFKDGLSEGMKDDKPATPPAQPSQASTTEQPPSASAG